jgi:hypothetical protein
LVQLGSNSLVARIRTEVYEILPDGQGVLITGEFLPRDIKRNLEALQSTTGDVPASR